MTAFGLSTGAVAKGDFERGLSILRAINCPVVELSALRDHELRRLIDALPHLDLQQFQYVSFHAPSAFLNLSEHEAIDQLKRVAQRGIPIVIHPDAITDFSAWRIFGDMLLVENMDKRKRTGRTVRELEAVFQMLPEARFCFDIAHARQIDPTMSQAYLILTQFGHLLSQVHLSEVDVSGRHTKLSLACTFAYPRVLRLIPERIPVVIESMLTIEEIPSELSFAADIWHRVSRSHSAAL